MQMTDMEIVASYRRADENEKKKQIKILAELNDCKRSAIKKILIAAGEEVEDLRGAVPADAVAPVVEDPQSREELLAALAQAREELKAAQAMVRLPFSELAERALTCLGLIRDSDSEDVKTRVAQSAMYLFGADVALAFGLEVH